MTHLHGDHCLGLPGVLQRIALDGRGRPVDLYFPAAGQPYVDRLRHASAAADGTRGPRAPGRRATASSTPGPASSCPPGRSTTACRRTAGASQEPDGRRVLPGPARRDRAERARRRPAARGRRGHRRRPARLASEVTEPRRGQSFAFVMDTRRCAARRRALPRRRPRGLRVDLPAHRGRPGRALRPPDRRRRRRHRGRGGRTSPRPHPLLRPPPRRAGVRRRGPEVFPDVVAARTWTDRGPAPALERTLRPPVDAVRYARGLVTRGSGPASSK